jgi:hypothetical protein
MEKLRLFLCASSGSLCSLVYHFGIEGSQLYDFCKPLPGVFPSQPSPSDAQETQLLASSLLGLQRKVTYLVVAFLLLRRATTRL